MTPQLRYREQWSTLKKRVDRADSNDKSENRVVLVLDCISRGYHISSVLVNADILIRRYDSLDLYGQIQAVCVE